MAAEDRSPADHLSFLAAAAADTKRHGLFPIARGAEARAPHLPRLGRARRPAQSIADLAQVPTLAFPDSTLAGVAVKDGRARVEGHWLGLTGPMGPLPQHLTEFAAFERRYARQQPFGRWLDVLAGRMLQFFYRAWADSQPAAQADRPQDDRFAEQAARLTGATQGAKPNGAFPAHARLHYAALFAGRRSAGAIEDALTHLLGQSVRVLEYQPRWRDIEPEDQTRLGRQFSGFGEGMVLGRRTRVASDAFRVVIRARSRADYEALLPGGKRFAILSEALDAFAPSHLEWDVALETPAEQAPAARLDGRTRLGWSGWLGGGGSDVRRDAHLRRTGGKAQKEQLHRSDVA
ncbi:type VI secretion system baseplate subunit TssG [Sphingomonas pseudosanguinis]|uniref:type VI secretion system baseplate subunit TssG n=1 Tax=Sphingomonas pseudosanguinis TaxID=413712 RepID=UPI003F836F06